MKLLPKNSKLKQGEIVVDGQDITHYKERKMRKLRANAFSMVFQDPMSSLNPTIPIGKQMVEAIKKHIKSAQTRQKSVQKN